MFFLLTFVITWSVDAVLIVLGIRVDSASGALLLILGVLGPTLSAVILSGLETGRRGMADLLRGALRWRVKVWWYAFVLAFWVVLLAIAWGVADISGIHPRTVDDPPLAGFPFLFLIILLIGGPLQEEFGWRGYALRRLRNRRTALSSSLIVGMFWGVWHIPIFFVQGTWHYDLVSGRSLPVTLFFIAYFVLVTVPLSVIYAWVYFGTGSLLLTILLHASMNTADTWAPWPSSLRDSMLWAGVEIALMVTAALAVVSLAGSTHLVRGRRTEPSAPAGIAGGLAQPTSPSAQ
jgi:membrane protease YdiL (CAAX protease family)